MSSKSKAKKDDDFQEDEVWNNWAQFQIQENSNLRPNKSSGSNNSSSSRIPTRKKNSRENRTSSGQSSAPLSIPDWLKINCKKSNMSLSEDGDSWGGVTAKNGEDDYDYDYDDNDNDDEMIPPHEIVARRQASSSIVSYSMCEGVGRTLKGRDLSKLRNSILTKTGFLE